MIVHSTIRRHLSTKNVVFDSRDLKFQLFQVLNVQETLFKPFPRFDQLSVDIIEDALESSGKVALDYFYPHNRKNDLIEPKFDGKKVSINSEVSIALKKFNESGFGSVHSDNEFGGMQFPTCISNSLMVAFYSANIGTVTFPFLTIAAGNMLRKYGTLDQLNRFLKPMLEGRFTGTMNLSETQAGSSLGDITTKAFKRNDGKYNIRGSKMWISGGEHELSENIVHMVLAKIVPDENSSALPGVKGISLFIVPKRRVNEDGSIGELNDITLGGLNKKMGWRGATNCVLNYGENNNCVGELMGTEGKGLAVMFNMMNEARISVGLIAASLGYSGYAASVNYAMDRRQGRPLDNKDPSTSQIPIIEHADVKRMLLQQKSYVEGALSLCLYASYLVDISQQQEINKNYQDDHVLLDLLTPIVKSWPSEWCLEANKWAIQIHGGYGYTRDYSVEQTYRDNRLNMIHEGTNGIQSLDLLTRKMKSKGFSVLIQRVHEDINRALTLNDSALTTRAKELQSAFQRIEETKTVLLDSKLSPSLAFCNSHEFLNMCGHSVIAWMWLRQEIEAVKSLNSSSENEDFYQGKRFASQYFFKHELPKTIQQSILLNSLDRTVLDVPSHAF